MKILPVDVKISLLLPLAGCSDGLASGAMMVGMGASMPAGGGDEVDRAASEGPWVVGGGPGVGWLTPSLSPEAGVLLLLLPLAAMAATELILVLCAFTFL